MTECKENLADIQKGLDSSDIQLAIAASHKLKGTASNIFVTQVFEQAKALESNLRQVKLPLSKITKSQLYASYETLKVASADFITSVEKV